MKAGLMDRYVTLERPTVTKSAGGAPKPTWAALGRVWAAKRPVSGVEVMKLERKSTAQVAEFQIYYFPGLTTQDRLVDDEGVAWDILQIADIGRRKEGMALTAQVQQ